MEEQNAKEWQEHSIPISCTINPLRIFDGKCRTTFNGQELNLDGCEPRFGFRVPESTTLKELMNMLELPHLTELKINI